WGLKKLLPARFGTVFVANAFHRANNTLQFVQKEPRQAVLQLFFRMFKPRREKPKASFPSVC
ncbi:MAG: hypothetical protein ACRC9V_05215, partial [Aeromonas sp.]